MLTIATVLRSGGVYSPVWVQRLAAQCKRSAPRHLFRCLSDTEIDGVETIPLVHDWPGWWAKMELFRTDLFDGPVLYFDLDTLIVGQLDDLFRVAAEKHFTVLRNFHHEGSIGSGVMAWRDGNRLCHLFEGFSDDPVGWQKRMGHRGDQGFIEEHMKPGAMTRWQDALPGQIASYKVHCRRGNAPYGTRVLCLHGKPKFPDMEFDDPVRLAWERAA